jgi:L-seryl-tRNA(Ser) seleniumtransferase
MSNPEAYRHLPAVDRLLKAPQLADAHARYPHALLTELARDALAEARRAIAEGQPAPDVQQLATAVLTRLGEITAAPLTPLINATGVIIHTNLGRAPLSAAAIAAMQAASGQYSSLEYDLRTGERGSRTDYLSALLRQLTGAEAAAIVNNNAAAVLLILSALAKSREVLVSRGQAVEIGGGFRIPDVMRQSGAKLVDVGTTNRTRLADYASAITPRTALLLNVHASNFRLIGFTEQTPLAEMAQLAHQRGLLLVDDLGSGSLLPTEDYGLAHEPLVQESIAAGADVVSFSGDKLLGGPQAGIIVGKPAAIERIRKHPLMRALRADKTTLAGLQATLLHYLRGEAIVEIPVWQMISATLPQLEQRAAAICAALSNAGIAATTRPGQAAIGGGSLPGETLPTSLVAITPDSLSVDKLAARLRLGQPPIVARIAADLLLLDPRTILPGQDEAVIAALRTAMTPAPARGEGWGEG